MRTVVNVTGASRDQQAGSTSQQDTRSVLYYGYPDAHNHQTPLELLVSFGCGVRDKDLRIQEAGLAGIRITPPFAQGGIRAWVIRAETSHMQARVSALRVTQAP